jgi:hypothetical protein
MVCAYNAAEQELNDALARKKENLHPWARAGRRLCERTWVAGV